MDMDLLTQKSEHEWWITPFGKMRVPAILYGSAALVHDMEAAEVEPNLNSADLVTVSSVANPVEADVIRNALRGGCSKRFGSGRSL
jgi:hypothetical protein